MTSIIIPMHNEEKNAPVILDQLAGKIPRWNGDYEIIAVDDNSEDRTPSVLEEYSRKYGFIKKVIKRDGQKGMGRALMAGGEKSKGDIIVWVMGDLSDDLDKIPEIVKKVNEGFDIVFASRYMEGGSSGDLDRFKAFLSSRFTVFARIFFGIKVHDITNAFRGFKKELIDRIKIESSDFSISPELAVKAHMLGYRLGEVPASYKTRVAGKTKFKIIRMVLRYLTLFRYRFYKRKDLVYG